MSLEKYREKRPAGRSPEPRGRPRKRRRGSAPHFVIQHHAASTDHYDFRLEIDGVLASWAVPKGPSVNPKDKRAWLLVKKSDDHGVLPATNPYEARPSQCCPVADMMSCRDPRRPRLRARKSAERTGSVLAGAHGGDPDGQTVLRSGIGFSSASSTECGASRFVTAATCA